MKSIFEKLSNTRGVKKLPSISLLLLSWLTGYNHKKYWKRRSAVINSSSPLPFIVKLYYLYYIKKTAGRCHCSFGTSLNDGAQFETPPYLPHGPQGVIVGHDAKIGKECIIYHQVTIAGGNVRIGNHTELGAGCKVLPGVQIGNYCHVGANAVVVEDMPDYSTCVMQKPRIILNQSKLKIVNEENS